jgi:hypothetical protein
MYNEINKEKHKLVHTIYSIWQRRKVVQINHLYNVSSNIFQICLSVLADVTAKMATMGLNELKKLSKTLTFRSSNAYVCVV